MINLEIIQELYRAFRQKDYDAFLRICTPDLEWIQNEGFPRGATYRGAEAVVEGVFKAFDDNWEFWLFDIEQYLDAGETVIVIGSYAGRYITQRANRFVLPQPMCTIFVTEKSLDFDNLRILR
jgi:uncharacterized protein